MTDLEKNNDRESIDENIKKSKSNLSGKGTYLAIGVALGVAIGASMDAIANKNKK